MAVHYHVRWLASGKIDWQRFDTIKDAEDRATDLVYDGEKYVIEPMIGDCETCAAFSPRAWPRNPEKKAANG